MSQKRVLYDAITPVNPLTCIYPFLSSCVVCAICAVCATAVLHLVDTVRGKRVAKAKAAMAAMGESDDNDDDNNNAVARSVHGANRGNASCGDGNSRSNNRSNSRSNSRGGGGGNRGGGYGSTNNTPYSSVDLHSSSDRSDSGRSLTGGVGGRDASGGEGRGGQRTPEREAYVRSLVTPPLPLSINMAAVAVLTVATVCVVQVSVCYA